MIKVYNTLTRRKEEFVPLKAGEASIYCCGVTPYNEPHIGNARPFVTWDVIRRHLARRGFKVRYIQNFTDVDDKIINAARVDGSDWKTIADRYITRYFAAMDALNVKRADVYPRVSETIPDIVGMIDGLISSGHAYTVEGGDVYFSVENFAGYGKLSRRSLEDMEAGARVEVNDNKRHPMDFALWKAAKPGEPSWQSPWGKGRPGWHIECSAMSLKFLGEKFDFHGGGSDLIFPHHENEIAQSQAYLDDESAFARYFLHNGFITIRNEKMSKSLNNFFTVADVLKEFSGETLRFYILQTHYRSPLDFSEERMTEAKAALTRLRHTAEQIKMFAGREGNGNNAGQLADTAAKLSADFDEAMDDDFNSALAIGYMFDLSKKINAYCQSVTDGGEFDAVNFAKATTVFAEMASVIGIFEQEENAAATSINDDLAAKLMDIIITLRQRARQEKNWPIADEIRDRLKDVGVVIKDTKNGAVWERR